MNHAAAASRGASASAGCLCIWLLLLLLVLSPRPQRTPTSCPAFNRTTQLATMAGEALETFLFTSESVNEGHPDKLCDQVREAAQKGECSKRAAAAAAAPCKHGRHAQLAASSAACMHDRSPHPYAHCVICIALPCPTVHTRSDAPWITHAHRFAHHHHHPPRPPLSVFRAQVSDAILDACLAQDPLSKVRAIIF